MYIGFVQEFYTSFFDDENFRVDRFHTLAMRQGICPSIVKNLLQNKKVG